MKVFYDINTGLDEYDWERKDENVRISAEEIMHFVNLFQKPKFPGLRSFLAIKNGTQVLLCGFRKFGSVRMEKNRISVESKNGLCHVILKNPFFIFIFKIFLKNK